MAPEKNAMKTAFSWWSIHRGPGHEVKRESYEGDHTKQVGPDVSSLGVDTEYRLETLLETRQGRSMTFLQEIVILQELWQVREADDFPRLELVPDVHGKHLRILGSVVD